MLRGLTVLSWWRWVAFTFQKIVVAFSSFFVRKRFIRLLNLEKPLVRFSVSWIEVWVKFLRQPAVFRFDFFGRCTLIDAESCVVVRSVPLRWKHVFSIHCIH